MGARYILEIAKDVGNLPVLHLATDIDLKMRETFPSKVRDVFLLACIDASYGDTILITKYSDV